MNYFDHFMNSKGNRDPYFQFVLNLFDSRPIKILELGCARNLSFDSRRGDGWSSFHFLNYISENGGTLDIVDIDIFSVNNCRTLLKAHPKYTTSNLNFYQDDCLKKINDFKNNIDLIYLDVGDDPELSLKCFDLMDKKNTVIFIDDFHTKGKKIEQKYPDYFNLTWVNNSHRMAIYKDKMPYIHMQIPCIE